MFARGWDDGWDNSICNRLLEFLKFFVVFRFFRMVFSIPLKIR